MLAGVVVAANALPMAVRLLDLPARAVGTGKPVSLVFSNVLCDNRQFGRVITMAWAQDADVFAAAETSPPWLNQLPALAAKYPYSFAPDVGIFGVAVFAKRPFTAELYRVGKHRMAMVRAEFSDYVLYVAHPVPPASAGLSEDNRIYIEALAARVAVEHKPVIVAGDLNATLWSHNLRPLIQQKMQWPNGSGLTHSWPAAKPLVAIQIDQILTKGAVAGSYKVLGDVGSDTTRCGQIWCFRGIGEAGAGVRNVPPTPAASGDTPSPKEGFGGNPALATRLYIFRINLRRKPPLFTSGLRNVPLRQGFGRHAFAEGRLRWQSRACDTTLHFPDKSEGVSHPKPWRRVVGDDGFEPPTYSV